MTVGANDAIFDQFPQRPVDCLAGAADLLRNLLLGPEGGIPAQGMSEKEPRQPGPDATQADIMDNLGEMLQL